MTGSTVIRRGDLIIAELEDARGGQIRKRRPYVVVSPDVLNSAGATYLAAPLTTGNHPYRYRVPCEILGRHGYIVLDQVYTINASDVRRPMGRVGRAIVRSVLAGLREMFEE